MNFSLSPSVCLCLSVWVSVCLSLSVCLFFYPLALLGIPLKSDAHIPSHGLRELLFFLISDVSYLLFTPRSTAASVSIAAGPYRSREDGELGADLLGHDALHQQYKANGSASHGSAGGDPVLEAWVQLADGAADEREAQRGRFSEMGDDDDEDDDEVDDEEDAAAADDNLEQARDRNDRSGQSGPGRIDQRLAMGRALAATDDELAQYDTADLVAGGLGSSRRPTEALVTPELIQGHSVSYRDQLFVVVQALANCIHTAVAIWLVTSPTASGIFVQIAFVDVFLISFQGCSCTERGFLHRCRPAHLHTCCSHLFLPGLLAFLIFGTKYRFVRPIVKRLRRLGKRIRRIFYADSGTVSGGDGVSQ